MEYLPQLTIISMLLDIGLLKLMHFNDLHLFVDNFHRFTPLQLYKGTSFTVDSFTCLYRYMVGILWDVKISGSYISKTIHLIAMRFTGAI